MVNLKTPLLIMQVITSMRAMMSEDSNNAVSTSFLLDDDSRYVINFSKVPNNSIFIACLGLGVAFVLKPLNTDAAFHFRWMTFPNLWNK